MDPTLQDDNQAMPSQLPPGMEAMLPDTGPSPDEIQAQKEQAQQDAAKAKEDERLNFERILKVLADKARLEDSTVRERKIREYRQLMLLWEGFTNIYWNESRGDWAVPNQQDLEEDEESPRNINIYRPYGESIIAALSTAMPGVVFYPDDAEVPEDIDTAEAYQRIVELISRHNKAPLMFIKALMILYNQGVVCGYNYYRTDPKFGTTRKYQIGMQDVLIPQAMCPNCGTEMPSSSMPVPCPGCGTAAVPSITHAQDSIPQIIDFIDEAKGREEFDLFGPLFVKLSYYARRQQDLGYIELSFEQNEAMLKSTFPEIAEKISGPGSTMTYERWSRLDPTYVGEQPTNLPTVRCYWFRPWWYEHLADDEDKALLNQKYPTGCYCIFINEILAEIYDENMDDHWTISFNPLSTYIHAMPLGAPLAVIQDIRNDLVDIQVQTAEYGIPETYVSSKTIDFDKYKQQKAKVGMLTKAKPEPGKDLSASFFSSTPAHLTPEVQKLKAEIDQDAQFSVGAFPSIYGGQLQGGSQTYGEYNQSKDRALQRLSLSYKIISGFWADLLARAAVDYARYIRDGGGEKFVTRDNGQFINSWIKSAQLTGKIGHAEAEFSDQLPLTWMQKKDVFMQLFQMQSPEINSLLLAPQNIELLKKSMGVTELYVPGDEDREKQLAEFYQLINSQPIIGMNGQPAPSVPIDPDIDKDDIHMEILSSLLNGPTGRYIKQASPLGYQNAVLHFKAHELNFAAKTLKPSGTTIPGQRPNQGQ